MRCEIAFEADKPLLKLQIPSCGDRTNARLRKEVYPSLDGLVR